MGVEVPAVDLLVGRCAPTLGHRHWAHFQVLRELPSLAAANSAADRTVPLHAMILPHGQHGQGYDCHGQEYPYKPHARDYSPLAPSCSRDRSHFFTTGHIPVLVSAVGNADIRRKVMCVTDAGFHVPIGKILANGSEPPDLNQPRSFPL
jgi:hypothetical protein